mgnify:CR=1 FL=1
MFKVLKFLSEIKKIDSVSEFSLLLKKYNRILPKAETEAVFKELKEHKNLRKNISNIFEFKCSEKEAYRREFNKPCPYCGENENMDSVVLDIIEKNNIYKLKKICCKCHKTYVSEGSKVRK